MNKPILFALLLISPISNGWKSAGQSLPALPTPLQLTRYIGVNSTTVLDCGGAANIDNRSQAIRHNELHSFHATGSGTWTVAMNFSDTSCTGPWSSFGSAATVTQATADGIGAGFGYHPFVQLAVSGANANTVAVNYSGWKQFYIASGGGGGFGTLPAQLSTADGTITGTIDGVNTQFTLSYSVSLLDNLTVNGVRMTRTLDYTSAGNLITFVVGRAPKDPGAVITCSVWQ